MNLAVFERMEVLAKACLSKRGHPNAEAFGRRACLSPSWAVARRASCAGAELAKDLWREKTDLSEQLDRCIKHRSERGDGIEFTFPAVASPHPLHRGLSPG